MNFASWNPWHRTKLSITLAMDDISCKDYQNLDFGV